ncbi:MAG: hypothetical protein JST22_02790 [Bacteroidetes bacterium]|nr:hypothetical protein [Bacteroidota bacterium]
MADGSYDVESLRAQLRNVEEQLEPIRRQLAGNRKWYCKAFAVLRSDYGFITFLVVAIVGGCYVLVDHVNPFQNYRDAALAGRLAHAYIRMGDRLLSIGEWNAARGAYHEALGHDPRNEAASYHLYVAELLAAGEPAAMDAALEQLAAERPGDAAIPFAQGITCSARRRYADAAEYFRRAIAVDSGFLGAHINLGTVALRLGDHATYLQHSRIVYRMDSGFGIAVNNMAYACALQHDFAEAVRLYLRLDTIAHSAHSLWLIGGAMLYRNPMGAEPFLGQSIGMLQQNLPDSAKEFGGAWPVGYVPADTSAVLGERDFVRVVARTEKLACVLCSYAVADALTGNLRGADAKLRRAAALLEQNAALRRVISLDLAATAAITNAEPGVRRWLKHASQSWSVQ